MLVKSTLEMKYVIQDLELRGLKFPVICGGAALTRKFVEDDLRREYSSAVFYAEDAFAGLHAMEKLSGDERAAEIEAGSVVREALRAKVGGDASAGCAARSDSGGGDSAAAFLGRAHRARGGFRVEHAVSNTSI